MGGRLGFGIVGFVLWYGRTVGRLWKGRVGIYISELLSCVLSLAPVTVSSCQVPVDV